MHAEPILWRDKKVGNTRLNGLQVQPEVAVVLIGHCHPLSLRFPYCLLFSAIALCGLFRTENNSETVMNVMPHEPLLFFLKAFFIRCD